MEWVWSAVVGGPASPAVSQGGEDGGVANSSSGQQRRETSIKGMQAVKKVFTKSFTEHEHVSISDQ